jgi:hypothetical protein
VELSLKGRARLTHLNLRTEYHGEEKALGVDLRLVLATDADDLVHFGAALKSLLYDNGNLRLPYLKPLQLTCEFEDHVLHIADLSFDGVTFRRFAITAEAEARIEVAFNASISDLELDALPRLGEMLLEELVSVDIEAAQGELFGAEAA